MADLLAQQSRRVSLTRGMEIEGEVIAVFPQELILDLGTKAEGVLTRKSLPEEQAQNVKVGDKITAFVISPESESGQVVLGMQRLNPKAGVNAAKFAKFEAAMKSKQVFTGKGLEVNKGGVIVEVQGVRGFLPISQVALAQIANPDELIGKELHVTVIEIDSGQNRLIFSQKVQVSEEAQTKLKELKNGQKVKGEVGAVMPFGLFIKLEDGLEGLVHISEVAWEKVEDLGSLYKEGQEVECSVLSVDLDSGKVNLSLKQLSTDPFSEIVGKFQVDDVVKGTISKVATTGVSVSLKNPSGEGAVEGAIPSNKLDPDTQYVAGNPITCIIDSIDVAKRRITLAPFVTSTKDLIYK